MRSPVRLSWFVLVLLLALACRRTEEPAPPMVTPSVTMSVAEAPIGSPVDVHYRFVVAPDARFTENYTVFVHFLDTERELMWTDDHQPPVPTREWKPGATIEYTRTMFIPKFPYTGETRVELGLVDADGERVPMAGETPGLREYLVTRFTLTSQTDNQFVVFKDGWQTPEVAGDGFSQEWQWSRKEGVLTFRNPRRDALLYLQLDQPLKEIGPQHVEVRVGQTVIERFEVVPGPADLRKIRISREQFGDADAVDVTIAVGRTFVPATIPTLRSSDARELGVRVFRAHLQPL